jgi:hypothetical protein
MGHAWEPSTWEAETGGLQVWNQPGYTVRLCLKKQNTFLSTGGMIQVVEHLSSKWKTLSSIPGTTNN